MTWPLVVYFSIGGGWMFCTLSTILKYSCGSLRSVALGCAINILFWPIAMPLGIYSWHTGR